jgi:hypothetical protein
MRTKKTSDAASDNQPIFYYLAMALVRRPARALPITLGYRQKFEPGCGMLAGMSRTTMPREEILRWALLTAYPEHWQVLLDGTISTKPHHCIPLIYRYHFAKAFWGEGWEYHHGRLIRHRDGPLAYLAWFL